MIAPYFGIWDSDILGKVFSSSYKARSIERCQNAQIKFLWTLCHQKKIKVQFGTATHFIEGILDYVHTDVWGPTKMASIRGNHYFVSFIDDYSGQCWVYNMKHKGKSWSCLWSGRGTWRKAHEKRSRAIQTWRRGYKRSFPIAMLRWGHRKALHSKGNIATKRGG